MLEDIYGHPINLIAFDWFGLGVQPSCFHWWCRSGIGDADPAPVGYADTGCPRSVKQRIKP